MNNALWYRKFGQPEQVLALESAPKAPRRDGFVRVKMLYAPVNASDLIPVTGAYQHRIILPQIAGYEGIGIVVEAPRSYRHLIGKRVLPLRGEGTWQTFVDCPSELAIPVPDNIESLSAARGYINPVAAWLMLNHFSPLGQHVLVTAASTDCAMQLGQWALRAGALSVTGIYRSVIHTSTLSAHGITAVKDDDRNAINYYASRASTVYDATGGSLAELILNSMPRSGCFVSYGLLSGIIPKMQAHYPKIEWFHIRNYLKDMHSTAWQNMFNQLWPLFLESYQSDAHLFSLSEWKRAIAAYHSMGRTYKPVIALS